MLALADHLSRIGELPASVAYIHAVPSSLRNRLVRRHAILVATLLLVAGIVYLVGNNLFPLIDRDEPRFAQASKQMLESGDWTTPRFLDEPRLNKPILIYWLQASSMKIVGATAAAARLPSSLASLATLGVLAFAWPSIIGHRRAFWSLLIFASALMPVYLAKVCMADGVQHLFIATAMLCLYRLWRDGPRWLTLGILGITIGLGMLTKGPPVLMYLGTTLVALWLINTTIERAAPVVVSVDREMLLPRAFMRIIFVLAIAALVCLPWAIALEHARPGALLQMFSKEVVERGTSAKEGHAGPPGFYLATFWVTYFPWCLFFPAALVHAWKRRQLPWVRFSLAAILGPWIFLEIYKTKLPHYWLPSFPFMAILTADVLVRGMRARIVDLRDRPFLIGAGVWAAAATIFAAMAMVVPFFGDAPSSSLPVALVFAVGIVALTWGVVVLLNQRRLEAAALSMGIGMAALVLFATCAYLPRVQSLTLASRVAGCLRTIGATVEGQVQMTGFKEPSLAFYQGGTIREQSDNGFFITAPLETWPHWTVIDDVSWQKTRKASPLIESQLIERGTFTGSAYADGKRTVIVHVLEKKIAATTMP